MAIRTGTSAAGGEAGDLGPWNQKSAGKVEGEGERKKEARPRGMTESISRLGSKRRGRK